MTSAKFNAILFDLDGTLLDTIEDLADSMNLALAGLHFPPRTADECKYMVGDGLEAFARRALPEGRADPQTVAQCMESARKDYASRWAQKTRPYEGIPQLLDELTRRKLPMTVLSNKPDEFTKVMVARLLPQWKFELVRGEQRGLPMKPDPAGAIEMARRLGLQPAEFAYLGDTNTDMRTAMAAGMFPVGVLWGFRPAAELLAHGAKLLIQRPLDLLAIL